MFRGSSLSGRALALSLVLVASCVPRSSNRQAAEAPVAAPTAPPPAPTDPHGHGARPLASASAERATVTSVSFDAGPAADAAPTPTASAATDDAGTAAPAPETAIEVERPYKLYERPRPKGTVYAAGRDQVLARWNVGGTSDPSFSSNRPGYHPWPRVRVDTKILSGHLPHRAPWNRRTGHRRHVLSVARVQAEARANGYWPFRLCSEAGLRRDQKMHGQTVMRFSITTHGRVAHAWTVRSKPTDGELKTCLRHALGKLEFKPAPGRRVDVELSVKLWPGDAPVPLIGPPDPDKAPDNPGQLDVSAIEKATADVPAAVRSCYRAALEHDPHLWGRIQFRVDLDDKGRVQHVAENESRFPVRSVAHCGIEALRKCGFHAAKGGALSFVYALRLGTLAPLPSTNPENQ